MAEELMLKVEDVYKKYRLGTIGGGTLTADLQSWWAKVRHKEDPNSKIGAKTYGKNEVFYALNGISFEVRKGEALGIIGGNGAGKSTTLKLISQVTAPTKGKIYLNGRITSMLEVGTGFHPELTGRENIYLNGAILGMTKSEIDSKIEEIIDFSECRKFIDTPVKRYSSGMYVKLAFSVAAHLDSEIMIMDEVLAVGDMTFQKKCIEKMKHIANDEGRTILYVSHNMNTIRQLCDRCIVLDKGKVVFEGDVEESIEKYMGYNKKVEQEYIFSDDLHKHLKIRDQLYMESLKMVSNNVVSYGESIKMVLKCKSKKVFDYVKFRFEIHYQDGNLLGAMFTDTSVKTDESSREFLIEMHTDHLIPGRYTVDIIAYMDGMFGNQQFLDGVYPGFSFEIKDELSDGNKLIWRKSDWGNVHLHDIRIGENYE